jgi:hypothetical protein
MNMDSNTNIKYYLPTQENLDFDWIWHYLVVVDGKVTKAVFGPGDESDFTSLDWEKEKKNYQEISHDELVLEMI